MERPANDPEAIFDAFWTLPLHEREARWFERAEALEPATPPKLLILKMRALHARRTSASGRP